MEQALLEFSLKKLSLPPCILAQILATDCNYYLSLFFFFRFFRLVFLNAKEIKHVCCLVGDSSQYMAYSTMEIVSETQSITLSDIYMNATVSSETNYTSSILRSENSASISVTPPLPSNCYRVCVCNYSKGKYR